MAHLVNYANGQSGSKRAEQPARLNPNVDLYEQRVQNRALGRPEWDQSDPTDMEGVEVKTLSHATTTDYADSVTGGNIEYDEHGLPIKKKISQSVYSYDSSRDFSQFVKEIHGR